LRQIWANPWLGFAVAAVVMIAFALVSAWLTPRGPITSMEALVSMGTALIAGVVVGVMTGSRLSMVVTPALFMIVFELARVGVDGPTVDGISLGTFYGVLAFGVGRVVHGVLVLAPMILGAVYGVALAGYLGRPTTATVGVGRWIVTAIATVILMAVAFFVSRPATTSPIAGSDGEPLPGSVAELITVPIGGHDQTLMIRGRNVESPVLLYLAGGPGGTDLGAMRRDVTLEQDFVVVTWEQRGAGKSYSALDPAATLTLDQMVSDTVEVTSYLRSRFDEERIYLVGNSWGATLGVLAVQQSPELFHAYVGAGQMVSQRETDIMFWEDTLAWAESTGDTGLADTLRTIGPPPYEDIRSYEAAVGHEHDWNVYEEFDSSNEMPAILFVPENNLMDRINGFRSFLDTFSVLYPQLQGIDFREDVTSLEVPVYLVLGRHEARGRAVLAEEWFELVEAPHKELVIFEHSGHRAPFDEPGSFAALMRRIQSETLVAP